MALSMLTVFGLQLPNLLKIFVEVERTGRQNQFYEKFSIRLDLGQILCEDLPPFAALPVNSMTTCPCSICLLPRCFALVV